MNYHRFVGPAVVLLAFAGCGGPGKSTTPTGVVYEGKHTSEWGDAVCGSDPQARLEAAKVLAKMGKEGQNANPAIPGLQKAIEDEDPAIRGWAAVALFYAARGTPFPVGLVGPKLKQAAESSDEELRAEAAELLKRLEQTPAGGPPRPQGTAREGGDALPDEKKPQPDEGKGK
jgi:hypothetical protein